MDDHEYELKQVELTLKEREVAAREREVTAKEKECNISKWFNPLTIAIYVAALGLLGNILLNILSNHASANAEHVRAQSNLLSTVIKTNGNDEVTCKNLIFVVNIKLLDDPDGAIQKLCGTKGGVPTLPASSLVDAGGASATGAASAMGGVLSSGQWFGLASTLTVRVEDADSHEPIANAKIEVEEVKFDISQLTGAAKLSDLASGTTSRANTVVGSTSTDSVGDAHLNFITSLDTLDVSKDGYESLTKPMSQSGLSGYTNNPTLLIDLHRTPKSQPGKH
jgi:hypothetical protein